MTGLPRIVIIGGGFAGLNAAKSLKGVPVEITIIDRRNFHLFQPLLYQVASAALNPADIAYPIRSIFRGQENVKAIMLGEVVRIDVDERSVEVDGGRSVRYDYLLVAGGATHSYFGNDAWEAHAPGLKTVEDALTMRRRVLMAFERAEMAPERRDGELTFVVVGGGPTGVELAGALIEIAVHALGDEFDDIDPNMARVILVEGGNRVLPTYVEKQSRSAQRQLESLGVEVLTDAMVESIDDSGVTLAGGERIEASTVLWAAGVVASPLGAMLGAPTDGAGRVVVGPDLSIPGHPEVFVAGDLAAVSGVPGVAPAAIQMGRHVAKAIAADLAGRDSPEFRYNNKGSVATIGRARGVADIKGVRFGGFLAWWAWLVIHLYFLIGFRNRLLVLVSWAWNYFTFRRGARIITGLPEK